MKLKETSSCFLVQLISAKQRSVIIFLCRAKSDPEISGSLMESSQQSGTLSKKDTARPTALLPAFRLILCVFGVTLADGDGVQEHLLPVCEDDACQRSAIYLSKSGSAEVLDVCIMNLVTCYTLFSMFLLFFYSPFKCDTNQLLFTAIFFLNSVSTSQHNFITWPVSA